MTFYADKSFDKAFSFSKGEYDNCVFENCDFTSRDLSGSSFADCTFAGCNFSLSKASKTAFRDVVFKGCKLLGFRFDQCDPMLFSAAFENCQLDLASFYRLKIRKQEFRGCSMRETDFAETDLAQAVFDGCDLLGAVFDNTVLEKADFRSSHNFTIDPEANYIRGAKFALAGIPGLLGKYGLDIEPK